MTQSIINQLRDALMPLIQESIDIADWNQNEWKTNQWGFDITEGDISYKYRLYSQNGVSDKSLTRYIPYIPDPRPEKADAPSVDGEYSIWAMYCSPSGATLWGYGDSYNPHAGKNIAEWSKEFIIKAKMHVAGING